MVYAGFWRRVVAFLIDALIIQVLFIFFAAVFDAATILPGGDVVVLTTGGYWLSVLLPWLYWAGCESSSRQGTLGKVAMGINVTDLEGKKISFGRATLRYFGKYVSGFFLGMGFLMAAITDKKQALHDILADSLVIMRMSGEKQQ